MHNGKIGVFTRGINLGKYSVNWAVERIYLIDFPDQMPPAFAIARFIILEQFS